MATIQSRAFSDLTRRRSSICLAAWIASASSVSQSGNHVFALPMKDPKGGLSSTGGYPWFIKESSSTVVFIKNTTDKPQDFILSVIYPGGNWGLIHPAIPAGQTIAVDLRKLRDSQQKGVEDNVIPPDAVLPTGFLKLCIHV